VTETGLEYFLRPDSSTLRGRLKKKSAKTGLACRQNCRAVSTFENGVDVKNEVDEEIVATTSSALS
jgi:hypothetical protein